MDFYEEYYDYEEEPSDASAEILKAFRIIVCVVGLLGNFFLFCVIFLTGDVRRAGIHWYVLQLSIADSLFLATLPFEIIETHSGWIFSEEACKTKASVLYINYYNSLLFIAVMALDRYFAICHSFNETFTTFRTHRTTYTITTIVWIISICLAVPVMLYSKTSPAGADKCVCEFRFPPDYREFCLNQRYEGEKLEECISEVSASAQQKCGESYYDLYDYGSSSSGDQKDFNTTTFYNASQTHEIFIAESKIYSTGPGTTGGLEQVNTTSPDISTTMPFNYDSGNGFEVGCSYQGYENGFIAFHIFNFAVMFVVPFTIITACYIKIIMEVRKSRFKQFGKELSITKAQKQRDTTKRRVTLMCLALVVVFVLCWLPYNLQELVKLGGIHGSESFCRNLRSATSLLIFINSALNPYIYMFGASFKSKMKQIRRSRAGAVIFSLVAYLSIFQRESTDSHGAKVEERSSEKSKSTKIRSREDEMATHRL